MFALLAACLLAATGDTPPGSPPIPDVEVPRYLRTGELSEWGNAIRLIEQGSSRIQTGQGVIASATTPRLGEKPEEVRARGEKMIAEGKALIARAQPSLARLRVVATARLVEQTKSVNLGLELTQVEWNYALSLAAIRFQKLSRDSVYPQLHLVGAITVLADGKAAHTPQVNDALRAAWAKVNPAGLAPAPVGGYTFIVNSAEPTPAFAKVWKTPTGPHQVGVVWVELHQLSADKSLALLVVNLADAYTLRLVGCEVALTSLGPAENLSKPFTGAIAFKDERNFLRRQVGTAEALAGIDREASPLGAALLRYVSFRDVGLPVPVAAPLSAVVGGDPALPENLRATWRVTAVPLGADPVTKAKPSPFSRAFAVASAPSGAKPIEVGQLVLRLEPPVTIPAPVVGKPAAK
ncbi:hypothetical protein LBMAG55_04320 [Verrucomicrobiota bacterium]|nr:hypothetical protein EMGBD4_06490 [Verrucomicrobiota bacterium]GDY17109.1 hypothetical protein LBMAG55_04320 [Verrucomicrobiota bacterium]